MTDSRIAVLMTCYNRVDKTLACLEALFQSADGVLFDVYLVDDGSSDFTSDKVVVNFSAVHVIKGSGSLFWNGGMNLAWRAAIDSGKSYSAFLWLNDDVVLDSDALKTLQLTASIIEGRGVKEYIVAGSVRDPNTKVVSYGAMSRPKKRKAIRFVLQQPTGELRPCYTFSGNVVLVSIEAFRILGELDSRFTHIYGDLDYGVRAQKMGVLTVGSGMTVGTCAMNEVKGTFHDKELGKMKRLTLRYRARKSMHARDWLIFCRLHSKAGWLYPLYPLSEYLRILAPHVRNPKALHVVDRHG